MITEQRTKTLNVIPVLVIEDYRATLQNNA